MKVSRFHSALLLAAFGAFASSSAGGVPSQAERRALAVERVEHLSEADLADLAEATDAAIIEGDLQTPCHAGDDEFMDWFHDWFWLFGVFEGDWAFVVVRWI